MGVPHDYDKELCYALSEQAHGHKKIWYHRTMAPIERWQMAVA